MIRIEDEGRIRTITLDRPHHLELISCHNPRADRTTTARSVCGLRSNNFGHGEGMTRPTCLTSGLLVCTGKKCRRDKGFEAMVEMAGDTARAHEAPCQGLCNGPIVGLHVDGELRWFSHVRSKKMRSLVAKMIGNGHVPKKLRDREVRKHRGEVRGANRLHPLDRHRAAEISAR